MAHASLQRYLERLTQATYGGSQIWLDEEGRVQGRFVNTTLTSAFQPIRNAITTEVVAYEGFMRSYSGSDQGLCPWKLLEQASDDNESVALDRLCRILHTVNFFRQEGSDGNELFLSVDGRLLAAVDSNHGTAFRRVLDTLELPQQRVVLQLPAVTHDQNWLLNYVSDNYRRNAFRLAVNARNAAEAEVLLDHVRPEIIKLDARGAPDLQTNMKLLHEAQKRGIRIIFKRVENQAMLGGLIELAAASGQSVQAQGYVWDLPTALLHKEVRADFRQSATSAERSSTQILAGAPS
jgi:EAL domain-containing protein (putative c-di-GMP-specific phosphodiesterase class I)